MGESEYSQKVPFKDYFDYRKRQESLVAEWGCKYDDSARKYITRRIQYDERLGYRTEFQMDRDDILYSEAFRKLAYKKQIFSDEKSQQFYTRLSHSLIVSQIARSISKGLQLEENLTEAIALGHDLGHAPFGHSGEKAINNFLDSKIFPKVSKEKANNEYSIEEKIKFENELNINNCENSIEKNSNNQLLLPAIDKVDLEKSLEICFYVLPIDKEIFDHHRQGYRIVRYLEKSGRGIDLSLYTLYGILKASASSKENLNFQLINEGINLDFANYETQVVRLADDIAWVNHDLTEDCIKANMGLDLMLKIFYKNLEEDELIHHDELKEFLLKSPGERYGYFISDAIKNNKDKLEPKGYLPNGESQSISLSDVAAKFLFAMQSLVISVVHQTTQMKRISNDCINRVEELCNFFYIEKNFQTIPEDIRLIRRKPNNIDNNLWRLRIIVDYISSLTDKEVEDQYSKLHDVLKTPSLKEE